MQLTYPDFLSALDFAHRLSKHEYLVFRALQQGPHEGSYSGLARKIGVDIANTRRACLSLCRFGVAHVWYAPGKKRVQAIYLTDNFVDNMVSNVDKLPEVKPRGREKR